MPRPAASASTTRRRQKRTAKFAGRENRALMRSNDPETRTAPERRKSQPANPASLRALGVFSSGIYSAISETEILAEGEGFEPSRRFPAYTLSRRAPSTTRPPLRYSHVLEAKSAIYPDALREQVGCRLDN